MPVFIHQSPLHLYGLVCNFNMWMTISLGVLLPSSGDFEVHACSYFDEQHTDILYD